MKDLIQVIKTINKLQYACNRSGNWDKLNTFLHPDNWVNTEDAVVAVAYIRMSFITRGETPNWLMARDFAEKVIANAGEDPKEILFGLYEPIPTKKVSKK